MLDSLTPALPSGDPLAQAQQSGQAHRAQSTFRVALDALARPGRVLRLPWGAEDAPGSPWVAALLLTLLDHETSLWVDPPPVATYLRQRTGARLVPLADAGFAVADVGTLGPGVLEDLLRRLRRGTLAYPDEGATLVLSVPRLAALEDGSVGACGADGAGLVVALSGPGVPAGQSRRLLVGGVGPGLVEARRDAVADYPAGIDLFLVDGEGRIAGLPRSAQLEGVRAIEAVEGAGDGL